MPDYDDEDDDQMQQGPVVVRRAVYDAAMKVAGAVKVGDMPAFETARLGAERYNRGRDRNGHP